MRNENLTIYGITPDGPAYCEAIGISKIFAAYAEYTNEPIIEDGIGFNSHSGYVYIALENGVTIASYMGNNVEYITTDFYSGDEHFFNSYNEALEFMQAEQSKQYENE